MAWLARTTERMPNPWCLQKGGRVRRGGSGRSLQKGLRPAYGPLRVQINRAAKKREHRPSTSPPSPPLPPTSSSYSNDPDQRKWNGMG